MHRHLRRQTSFVFTMILWNLFLSFPLWWPTLALGTRQSPVIRQSFVFEKGFRWLWVQAQHTVFIINQLTLLKPCCKCPKTLFNELLVLCVLTSMSVSTSLSYWWAVDKWGWIWCKPLKIMICLCYCCTNVVLNCSAIPKSFQGLSEFN